MISLENLIARDALGDNATPSPEPCISVSEGYIELGDIPEDTNTLVVDTGLDNVKEFLIYNAADDALDVRSNVQYKAFCSVSGTTDIHSATHETIAGQANATNGVVCYRTTSSYSAGAAQGSVNGSIFTVVSNHVFGSDIRYKWKAWGWTE